MVHLMLTSLEVLYKQHKHVAVKIESTWGTSHCDNLLYEYLIKNRDERQGFCPSVYKEILNLYVIHSGKYGSKHLVLALNGLNVKID